MSTVTELPKTEYASREVSDSRGFRFRNLDLTNDPETSARILAQKYWMSKDTGKDIGLGAAIVAYYTDNPSQIPVLQDKRDEYCINPVHCKNQQIMEVALLPIAIAQHRWFMVQDQGKSVPYNEAWLDFKKSFYDSWESRKSASTCVLCENSTHCSAALKSYSKLEDRKKQGLALIPIVPERKDSFSSGLAGLVSAVHKH